MPPIVHSLLPSYRINGHGADAAGSKRPYFCRLAQARDWPKVAVWHISFAYRRGRASIQHQLQCTSNFTLTLACLDRRHYLHQAAPAARRVHPAMLVDQPEQLARLRNILREIYY